MCKEMMHHAREIDHTSYFEQNNSVTSISIVKEHALQLDVTQSDFFYNFRSFHHNMYGL